MGSLKSSGWTIEDCFSELKQINDKFNPFISKKLTDEADEIIENALSSASLIYLSDFENLNLKEDAFKTCEMLEYVKQKNFWYLRYQLKNAMFEQTYFEDENGDHEIDSDLTHAMDCILEHFDNLIKTHGFQCLRNIGATFNSKYGNYANFPYFQISCFDNKPMLQALVLANEIVANPFDFLDASKDAVKFGFDNISDYLSFVANENFDEYFKNQMNRKHTNIRVDIGFLNAKNFN